MKRTSHILDFAEDLRRARIFRGLELSDISESTRVNIEHLEALENGLWDSIPRGFLRGYLDLYVQAAGLNREKVLKRFDQLINQAEGKRSAYLDSSGPLIHPDDRVGLTRTKIPQLATLSRLFHRPLVYSVCFGVLIIIWLITSTDTSLHGIAEPAIPFDEVLQEYQRQTHGPYTMIPLGDQGESIFRKVEVSASGSGQISYHLGEESPNLLYFNAFDTIRIEFRDDIGLKLHPSLSAVLLCGGKVMKPNLISAGDTAFYRLNHSTQEEVEILGD